MADHAMQNMNLNEYMVTLERPLGIRFALSVDGRVFVHSMQRGGNAEKARIIMVGDTIKLASGSSNGTFVEIKDLQDTQNMINEASGPCSLVLERPFTPFPLHELPLNADYNILFNKGRVPLTTWNSKFVQNSYQKLNLNGNGDGRVGFAIFSPQLLSPSGWAQLSGERNGTMKSSKLKTEIIAKWAEDQGGETDWSFGGFPLEEYIKALDRAKDELCYNHSLGMQYSKITEQIYVGSCIQREKDVETLANDLGITAVLNFQSERERINWGIDSGLINQSCKDNNILMINYPIREIDSADLRKKLPFCVGLLLRLLRKNYKIYVTCTSGFDRSPTCIIAYLHWIQDTALHAAFNFVTGPHVCRPNRVAVVSATWDLIAMADVKNHEGPPTHSVTFVWNNSREGEEVFLIGDFTNNWKDKIPLAHKGGTRYEAEVRLRHGKYYYKFIASGQWKHSTSLPTEHDEHGNINNVIRVGDIAQIRPSSKHLHITDPLAVKVIERPLTEDERFLLAFAARLMAFAICPLRLCPK
ncbi:phosphoglucan phosphatase LSF1 [Carex littledalei]|uniref:Phosphoglucan phosphatase LSF1 n=1 Tax=Carex littledalei TaxID=544730 RepID=A0A833VZQ0_9POAL|nr:phosphoglucan phosphatase LSF1 [Carex littledalei]